MHFMRMREYPQSMAKIPRLDGGLNVQDLPQLVEDNQLTAAENVWWHEGSLRTRPGLVENPEIWVEEYNIRQALSEQETLLARYVPLGPEEDHRATFSAACLTARDGFYAIGNFGRRCEVKAPLPGTALSAMGVKVLPTQELNSHWLYFLSSGDILKENTDAFPTEEGWMAADANIYVPTVRLNGRGYTDTTGNTQAEADSGNAYEDFNMLSPYYKAAYTTDGTAHCFAVPLRETADTVVESAMLRVRHAVTGKSREIRLPNHLTNGEWTTIPLEETGLEKTYPGKKEIGVAMESHGAVCRLVYRHPDSGAVVEWAPPQVGANSLVLTAMSENTAERMTICRMQRCVWFGGDRSSVEGGTRLFVCGNPDTPHLIHWSDVNKPLYFPRHNCAYVGDATQPVTAFGRQGSLLILFKEREIYAAEYVAGTAEDYRTAQEGGAYITAYTAQFPITPICSTVGCDCPNTVRLVNNRLVWACAGGRVYALTGANRNSGQNVGCLSRNIQPLLEAHSRGSLQNAGAGEYAGYYVLQVDNTLYLMDATSAAYSRQGETGTSRIVWYVWTLPQQVRCTGIVADGGTLRLVAEKPHGGNEGLTATFSGNRDFDKPIGSRFTTKIYDFGAPDQTKNIQQILIGAGVEPGGKIHISYLTERGAYGDPVGLSHDGGMNPGYVGYLPKCCLTPHVRMAQTIGLCLESDSAMNVDGVYIKYKTQGGIR